MFTTPAINLVQLGSWLGQRGHHDKFRSRVRDIPEFGGELSVACMAEEMETPGDKQIRALITHAGNPVLSTPNGRRLDAALSRLDFMVAIDIYLNETTRHANIILPPTFALEHDHYDLAFHALAVRNTAKYSAALFPKGDDQRHDWEILTGLIARLLRHETDNAGARAVGRLTRALGGLLEPARALDALLRIGPHGLRKGRDGLTLRKLRGQPHGVDLGPLQPCMPAALQTRDRTIQLSPKTMIDDMARVHDQLRQGLAGAMGADGSLLLIGRRQLRSNNSWCHNSPRLVKGPERCTLLMHPSDARAHGIVAGDQVSIASRVGSIVAPVEISDEVMLGVVSLPHGFGHNREGTRWRVAEAHAGVSINDITDETLLDPLAGTVHFSGVPVKVQVHVPPSVVAQPDAASSPA